MVKVNFIASFLLAIVMLASCSNVAKKSIEDLTVENIQGTLLHPDDKCIGAYPRLITQDFWLSQVYRDDVNCCICVQDGDSLLAKRNVFNKGKGRGEYDEVSFALSSDGALGVLNYANGNQLLSFSSFPKSDLNRLDFSKGQRFDLTKLPSIRFATNSFQVLSDSTILLPGAPFSQAGHLFSIIDFKNLKAETLDFWPQDKFAGDSLSKHSVYTDNSRIFKSKDRFLYLCGWERYAFIFSIDKNKVEVKNELFSVKPEYKEAPDGNYELLKNSGKRLAIDVDEDAIYVLMIEKNLYGKTPKNYMESQYGNEIQVYDWDGNPIRRIALDKVGSSIKISADKKNLYLFSENPKTKADEIWMYNL